MIVERWKVYKDFGGRYEVSNHGRVRALARYGFHPGNSSGRPHRFRIPARELKQGLTSDGYPKINIGFEGRNNHRTIHRMVAEMFVPGNFYGAQVNHKDGNKKNNLATNLEWTTGSNNVRHAYRVLGRPPATRGEEVYCSKLTEGQVRKIRKKLELGQEKKHIAQEFGVHYMAIYRIAKRQTWAWLE